MNFQKANFFYALKLVTILLWTVISKNTCSVTENRLRISVHQHVQYIVGHSETGTTCYGGLSAVGVRGTVLRAEEVQLCG
jgi:hypothetical protein